MFKYRSASAAERRSAAASSAWAELMIARSWDFLRDGAGILPASNMADPLRGSNLGPTSSLLTVVRSVTRARYAVSSSNGNLLAVRA